MAGFRLGADYLKRNFTLVDNEFIFGYLPSADPVDVKVYLYGLSVGGEGGFQGSLDELSLKLKIPTERAEESLKALEAAGLLSVNSLSPLDIVFHAVKAPVPKRAAQDLKKYSGFQNDMIQLFPDKFLVPNDVVPFMELLHDSKMEPTAMLQIVQYCIRLKGEKVSTPYMLAVANNWISEGIKTEKAASDRIEQLEASTAELLEVLAALGVKSQATLEDRERYQNWRAAGFSHEAVLAAAKLAKKVGGTTRLDRIVGDLRQANAFTPAEIESYKKELEFRRTLASTVVKNLGGYYASLDAAIETYIVPWLQKGFEPNGLVLLSRLAFKRSVKTLEGLDALVTKFFRLGLVSEEGISSYIDRSISTDEAIKELLELAGAPRYVSNRDREFYRVWAEDWKLPSETLQDAAKLSAGRPYPMSAMNGILLNYRATGKLELFKTKPKKADSVGAHDYKAEDLNGIFTDLSDVDNIEV